MVSRRNFVATLGAMGTAAVAGCQSKIDSQDGKTIDKDVPAPRVQIPDGWKLKTPDSQPRVFAQGEVLGLDWTAVGHTNQYENVALRKRIKHETMGRVNRPLMVAFASQIEFFPSLAHLGTGTKHDLIDNKIQSKLTDKMSDFGLQNVSYDGKITNTGAGPSRIMTFSGQYPVKDITIQDVNIPNVEKDSFTIEGEMLDIAGIAGYKKDGTTALISGGVYPNENFADQKHWNITGGISLDLSVNLDLTPNQYYNTLTEFMANLNAQ